MRKYQSDVIIIGGGIAGITTALELLNQGRKVLIIDRDISENFGGLASQSFGGVFMVNTPTQQRMGIKDKIETALSDWYSYAQFRPDDFWPRQWAREYVERSYEDVYLWLRKYSINFSPVVHWVERGYDVPGNSVPRFHIIWGTGKWLMQTLIKHLKFHHNKHLLQICFCHRVTQLEVFNGRVGACIGMDESAGTGFYAQGEHIVIATGGTNGSIARVRDNWYNPWGTPPEVILNGGHKYGAGDLHDEVKRVGGNLTHLDQMWNYAAGVHHPHPQMPLHGLNLVTPHSALWVDADGKRIGPPHLLAGYDTRYLVREICRQKNKYSWLILNRKIAVKELAVSGSEFNDAIANRKIFKFIKTILLGNPAMVDELSTNCIDFVNASSLPELVEKMNHLQEDQRVKLAVLHSAVSNYDHLIKKKAVQNDDQLRRIAQVRTYRGDRFRTCKFQKIIDSRAMPLMAIRLSILSCKSMGGIQTNLQSQVLTPAGAIIPGLYAVGEASGFGGGGIHGKRALEGTFLGSCILSGQSVARAIIA